MGLWWIKYKIIYVMNALLNLKKCFIYNSYVFATFSSSPSQKQKKNCNKKKKQICKNITHYKYKPQQKYHSLLYHQQKKQNR